MSKIYNVIVTEEYKDKSSGEIKTLYHRVGSAFEIESGGMSVVIPEGISLSGRFVILPRKDNEPQD